MQPMPIADLNAIASALAESGDRVHVLWQEPESLAFVALTDKTNRCGS